MRLGIPNHDANQAAMRKVTRFARGFLFLILVALAAQLEFRSAHSQDTATKKIVPFVPTPQDVVDAMIELADVKQDDVVYDLGSGDGRIVIAAAKKGAKAVGFEVDPQLVTQSRENILKAGVENLAEIRQQDILTVDVSPASVVSMYLLPSVNLQLKPTLQTELEPGSRVVSHAFDMGDWKPDKTEQVNGRTIYLWVIAAKK